MPKIKLCNGNLIEKTSQNIIDRGGLEQLVSIDWEFCKVKSFRHKLSI